MCGSGAEGWQDIVHVARGIQLDANLISASPLTIHVELEKLGKEGGGGQYHVKHSTSHRLSHDHKQKPTTLCERSRLTIASKWS